MKFAAAAKRYIEDLQLRRRARSGVTSYRCSINRYAKWLAGKGYPDATVAEAFNAGLLREYRKSLNHLANKTIWGAFHPLRELGRLLAETGDIAHNSTRTVPMPDKESPPRVRVTDGQVTALLLAMERLSAPSQIAFMRLLVSTLIHCGLRASELVGIRMEYLHSETETLSVLGKNNKWRELSPPTDWWVAANEWLRHRQAMGCTHDWLFAQNKGRRISAEGLRDALEELKALADLKHADHIKLHALRHWFARNMHRNGATIPEISVALGHTRPMTTFIYLGLDKGDTKAMRQYASFQPPAPTPESVDITRAVVQQRDRRPRLQLVEYGREQPVRSRRQACP